MNRKTPSIVIEQIRVAILDRLYKPGERLMEADVAAPFKVGVPLVRDALQAIGERRSDFRCTLFRDFGQTALLSGDPRSRRN